MFINPLLDGSGAVVPHTLTLCKDKLTRHYEICSGVYGMILDTLVGSKCYKKSFKLSDSNRIYLLLLSLSFVLGGLPRWLSGKESISQCSRHRKYGFYPCVGKIPWRKKGNLLLYSCLGNTMDRSLVGYSPWSQKTWT